MHLYGEFIFPLLNEIVSERFSRDRTNLLSQAEGDVLEIGFGSGFSVPDYPPTIRSLTGLEPNQAQLRRARELSTSATSFPIRLVQGLSEGLPFEDESFNCVVSIVTLCSVDDIRSSIKEIRRVLRANGKFLFIKHGMQPKPCCNQNDQNAVAPLWRTLACGCNLTRHPIEEMKRARFEIRCPFVS